MDGQTLINEQHPNGLANRCPTPYHIPQAHPQAKKIHYLESKSSISNFVLEHPNGHRGLFVKQSSKRCWDEIPAEHQIVHGVSIDRRCDSDEPSNHIY